MDWGTLLRTTIYAFRDLFGSQNFALFCTYLWGVILCDGRHTVTGIYLASPCEQRYWSLIKFLSRGHWDPAAVVRRLLALVLAYVPERIYVYDHTHALKTGKKQASLHFFRNHRYRRKNTNQSKFHWGHEFAALGLLALSAGTWSLLPLWVKLLEPGAASALAAFEQVLAFLPAGLIIFDRGFNNRKYFTALLKQGQHLLCRARSNMVFYYLPNATEQPTRGRKRIYGTRADYRKWRYARVAIDAFDDPVDIAQQIVRSKSCPQPVRLVVRRTRSTPSKPYRYFLVYTTDLTLSIERILTLYKRRWTFETSMHDSKESFGFDHYQVRSKHAIERHVQLSFVAASLLQLLALPAFVATHEQGLPALRKALEAMNIHWYQPMRWTLGLIIRYLKWSAHLEAFWQSMGTTHTREKCKPPHYTEAA